MLTNVARMNLDRLSLAQKISAGSIIAVVLSVFLPWISVLGYGAIGLQTGLGILVLLLALGGGAVLATTTGLFSEPKLAPGRNVDIGLMVGAGLVALLGLINLVNARGFAGIGLIFLLLGGIGWAAGAVWHFMQMRSGEAVPQAAPGWGGQPHPAPPPQQGYPAGPPEGYTAGPPQGYTAGPTQHTEAPPTQPGWRGPAQQG